MGGGGGGVGGSDIVGGGPVGEHIAVADRAISPLSLVLLSCMAAKI